MNNYKVKVNNEAESREVQLLGEQLGYVKPQPPSYISMKNGGYVCLGFNYDGVQEDLILLVGGFKESDMNDIKDYKELTIPQLKDLVVLKRNDKSDRNVIDPEYDANLYLDSDNKLFVFHLPTQTWKESNLNGENEVMQRLKPVSPLKEYLVPQGNGKYALTKATEKRVSDWVEVPEGANILTICETFMAFWKDGAVKFINADKDWDFEYELTVSDYFDVWGEKVAIAWQRHTQPEALPFVDDEPKLNIPDELKDRKDWISEAILIDDEPNASTHSLSKWFKPEQQKAFAESAKKVADSLSKLSRGVSIPSEPKSLNDTYAEIEQVRQQSVESTLAERQSTYGDFTSVANTTGQLMAVILNSKNGQTLPYAHEEALHMICSKIARIMNGDMNHKDSWHDIGGYAKLVEDIIN